VISKESCDVPVKFFSQFLFHRFGMLPSESPVIALIVNVNRCNLLSNFVSHVVTCPAMPCGSAAIECINLALMHKRGQYCLLVSFKLIWAEAKAREHRVDGLI
jgi:hypothetical protein